MESDLKKLWNMMEDNDCALAKIVLDAKGVKGSRLMILVDGVKEVAEIKAAVEKVEALWDRSSFTGEHA